MSAHVIYHDEIEQNTPEWDLIRCGMPTASEFTKLLTPAKLDASKQVDDYALELAASIWASAPIDTWEGNYWTERGHDLEEEARAWYTLNTQNEVRQVGFVENTTLKAGCSPDGLIDPEEPRADRGTEIVTGADFWSTKNGLLEIKNFGVKEHIRVLACTEIPKKYTIQPYGQMLVCERKWVDVLFYHPNLPKRMWRVTADEKIHSLLTSQIKVCNGLINHYLDVIKRAA